MAWTEPPRTWTDGELVTASIMNTHVRDQLKTVPHVVAYKSADETLNTNTTLQNDDALFFTVAANEVWAVWCMFIFNDASAGTANGKIAWTFPSGALALTSVHNASSGTLSTRRWTVSGTSQDIAGLTIDTDYDMHGTYLVGGTGGTLQCQWAQNTSNASNITVRKGSNIVAVKLA